MSGGGIQRHSRAEEEEEEHEEDFYDCPDTLEPPDPTAGGEESQQDVHFKHTQIERGDTEREAAEGHQGEERGDRLKGEEDEKEVKALLETEDVKQGEEGVDGLKEEEEVKEQQDGDSLRDSDSELKEEVGPAVEFDDDYLREVEKELTEEETEVTLADGHLHLEAFRCRHTVVNQSSSFSESTAAEHQSEGGGKRPL